LFLSVVDPDPDAMNGVDGFEEERGIFGAAIARADSEKTEPAPLGEASGKLMVCAESIRLLASSDSCCIDVVGAFDVISVFTDCRETADDKF
jgi:hypothetical protein